MLREMGRQTKPVLESDATAALANAAKLGPGKMRHLITSAMYVKGLIRRREVKTRKVASDKNVADLLTKPYSGEVLARHVDRLGLADLESLNVSYRTVELKKINVLADLDMHKGANIVGAIIEQQCVVHEPPVHEVTEFEDANYVAPWWNLFLLLLLALRAIYLDTRSVLRWISGLVWPKSGNATT